MFDKTDVFGLPTWAVVLIAVVFAVMLADIVNNVTKIWREPKAQSGKPGYTHGPVSERGISR
jgi:hypothetical protein